MATHVTVHEAKTHLSRLIAEALNGGEVVISRGKVPAVKLVPVDAPVRTRRKAGSMKGLIAFDESFFDPLPDDELALWNGEGD